MFGKKDVFISYSSADYDEVNHIKSILEANGISCWMAPDSIPSGSSYAEEIPAAIKACKVFLLMLTSKSQKSKWVPKEVSLALSESKCVIPFVIEQCTLTDVFNFFLTDVQRYYVFEIKSENLKELIDRIKYECGTLSEQSRSVLFSNISHVDTWVVSREKNTINRELLKFLSLLRKGYKANPNANIVRKWMSNYYIESFAIEAILESLTKCMIYLGTAAEIYIQIALIYIHSGEKSFIKNAREALHLAIQIYSNQSVYDDTSFKRIIYARWLIAVTYKQERNFGIANDICEELIDYIHDENKIFDVPFSDSLLLPQRELIVINKEEIISDYLVARTDDIRINPKEHFYTQRRLLELYILNNDFNNAKNILPELLQSFDKCKNYVDEIYHIGLFQNLFEYYSYVGDKESAEKYYRLAMENAKKNFWKGKEKKLMNLKQVFE